jgi:hypothetical protein
MTRTSGPFRQILIVAIFASAMFFFAYAVSRAQTLPKGPSFFCTMTEGHPRGADFRCEATWTLYGNITGLPVNGPFATAEDCQAERTNTVPPTDYTCSLTGSPPTPLGSRAEATHRSIYALVVRNGHIIGNYITSAECLAGLKQLNENAGGGAGADCVKYVVATDGTDPEGMVENKTTDDGGGWILIFQQLGKSTPPPNTLYGDHDECLAAGYKAVLDFHRQAREALTFNCLPRTEGGPNPVTITWTLMVTYPHPSNKGEYASKPAGPTEYNTLSECLEAGKKETGYLAVGCEHH